jgi:hypothetical protein
MDISRLLIPSNHENALSQPAQPTPTSQSQSGFHYFPLLPTELEVQIWLEAASVPRIVSLELGTTHRRSTRFVRHGQVDQDANLVRKVPSLLHVNHQARQVCLPIYKTHLQIPSCDNWWETYILADHDLLSLSRSGLQLLVDSCELQNQHFNTLDLWFDDVEDYDIFEELSERAISGELDIADLDKATPPIKALLEAHMEPPPISRLCGDLGSVKRLIVHDDIVQDTWPSLLHDTEVFDNLGRAFTALSSCNFYTDPDERATLLSKTGVAALPERYHCRLLPDPGPTSFLPRTLPGIAVSKTPLDLNEWLRVLTVDYEDDLPTGGVRGAFNQGLCRHDVVLWHFSEPLHGARSANTDSHDLVAERYLAHLQTLAGSLCFQMVTVYDYYQRGMCPNGEVRACSGIADLNMDTFSRTTSNASCLRDDEVQRT